MPDSRNDWFASTIGQRFLHDEQQVVASALDTVFGEHLVQIGMWGAPSLFLAQGRTQHKSLIDWRADAECDMRCELSRLAIASDSVDAVLLPHTLELAPSAHALLRETNRILRADGHLIVLSFAPNGPWGIRHLLTPSGYPRGQRRMIREGRLRDWLELLSFAVGPAQRFCHALPIGRFARFSRIPEESWASTWLPFLGGGYCLAAQKRVQPLTPLRNPWRPSRLRVVGGLVEPTTRNSQTRESS